jgi:GTP cyclohydrolase I
MPSSPSTQAPKPVAAGQIVDVQGTADHRRIAIDRVGVKDVTFPLQLKQKDGRLQHTVAKVSMYVGLPHTQKGTHMSRFLEVLNTYDGAISPQEIPAITDAIRERLHAETAHFEAEFTYFIKKFAPVSRQPGLMDYRVKFACSRGATQDLVMTVAAPATSLCPCSKEISDRGAHNQRCLIEASVRMDPARPVLWIEDLVTTLEGAASEELFAVLKRPDEKHVTEGAYDNPKFVEDIVRDLAMALDRDERISWYSINSENFESIHSHNAYAQITRDKRG